MTGFTRHNLPADIAVFSGAFASQPLVFAHLLDTCSALDLGHVEVIQSSDPARRLSGHFDAATAQSILAAADADTTLVLILPAAFDGLECPFPGSARLRPLGVFRGTIPHLTAEQVTP